MIKSLLRALLMALGLGVMMGSPALWAHCDGLDGPVVTAARTALAEGNVNRVLIWVPKRDAAEIRDAFKEAMTVRKLGENARALADKYFFETVVRVHRSAEGAPYTGLKPAGRNLGPAIPAADTALKTGSDEALVKLLTEEVRHGLHAHFKAANEKKSFKTNDVAAGRTYVDSYVTFIHYAERLYEAARRDPTGHYPEEH